MAGGLTSREGGSAAWRAECRHLGRSRWDLAFVTVLPLAILVLMAWLLSAGGMRALPVAVVDQDRSPDSRLLLRMIDASPGVSVVAQPRTPDAAFSLVRRLDAFAVVVVPPDFTWRMRRGEAVAVLVHYNASYLASGQSAMRDIDDAVGAFNARMLPERLGAQIGPARLRAAPITAQATVLFNPGRSYALFLLPLVAAAVLSLCGTLAMTVAMGRELRDGRAAVWPGDRPLATIAGKLLPYVLLFSAYGLAFALWVAHAHGRGPAGSVLLLALGQVLLHLAGGGLALLFVGLTRDMGTALSLVGLMVGTALAFTGTTFPVIDAPVFVRVWSAMLPLTAYLDLQMQQLLMGVPAWHAWRALLAMLAAALVGGGIGAWRLRAAGRTA